MILPSIVIIFLSVQLSPSGPETGLFLSYMMLSRVTCVQQVLGKWLLESSSVGVAFSP